MNKNVLVTCGLLLLLVVFLLLEKKTVVEGACVPLSEFSTEVDCVAGCSGYAGACYWDGVPVVLPTWPTAESPTESPTASPTESPTESPTASPTESPTASTASTASPSPSPEGGGVFSEWWHWLLVVMVILGVLVMIFL